MDWKKTVEGIIALLKMVDEEGMDSSAYLFVAEWRLEEGDWYRVREALGNAGIEKDGALYNIYKLRCARQVLALLESGKIFGEKNICGGQFKTRHDQGFFWAGTIMKPKEIEEIISHPSKEEFKLLAKLQSDLMKSGFVDVNHDDDLKRLGHYIYLADK